MIGRKGLVTRMIDRSVDDVLDANCIKRDSSIKRVEFVFEPFISFFHHQGRPR